MELKTSDQFKDRAQEIGTVGQRFVTWLGSATPEEIESVVREAEEGLDKDLEDFYANTSISLFDHSFDELGVDVSELDEDAKQMIVQAVFTTLNFGRAVMKRAMMKDLDGIAELVMRSFRPADEVADSPTHTHGAALERALEETGGVGEVVKRNARKGKATRARKSAKGNKKAA